jgi:uncharacterized membrane protein HdeD (DUF308 family)
MPKPGSVTNDWDPRTRWPDAPAVVQRGWAEQRLRSVWWLFLAHGLLALVAGILLLVWPGRSLLAIGLILGIYLVALGVVEVIRALASPGMLAMERAIPATLGLLAVGAGTIAIVRPEASVLAIALATGIYLIVAGLAAGVNAVREPGGRGFRALSALINLGAGIVIVAWPDVTVTAVAVVLGIGLVIRGAVEVVFSIHLLRARAHMRPTLPSQPRPYGQRTGQAL